MSRLCPHAEAALLMRDVSSLGRLPRAQKWSICMWGAKARSRCGMLTCLVARSSAIISWPH
jgi:hypothetical protein